MSIVFAGSTKPFNSYPEKYQYDNWNKIAAEGPTPEGKRFLDQFVAGNFMCFMNHLLDFQPGPTVHPWVPKKARRFGAR